MPDGLVSDGLMCDYDEAPSALFDRFPMGWSEAHFDGRRYGVTVSEQVSGRSRKLYAEELGGQDIISANLYRTGDTEVLRPCEMSRAKVTDFVERAEVG